MLPFLTDLITGQVSRRSRAQLLRGVVSVRESAREAIAPGSRSCTGSGHFREGAAALMLWTQSGPARPCRCRDERYLARGPGRIAPWYDIDPRAAIRAPGTGLFRLTTCDVGGAGPSAQLVDVTRFDRKL